MMLHEFIIRNSEELIRRCREKDIGRLDPAAAGAADIFERGVPVFLKQLAATLELELGTLARNFGKSGRDASPVSIASAAALHGAELLRAGYSIDQVVHGYGDVCQSVTELAMEQKAPIGTNEFRILNRCLDDAIAGAVTSFGVGRQARQERSTRDSMLELHSISEDQERLIDTAMQAFSAVRTGSIGLSGATGTVLMHTLLELRDLAKRIIQASALPGEPAAPAATPPKP